MRAFFEEFARWVRYTYFLRFAILLWLFGPLMVALNSPRAARSLVSGIITPVTPLQYVCVAFFLISASVVALILARVVVINGQDRFGDQPPWLLTWLLANPNQEWEWIAPLAFQFNNAYVFWYFFSNGATEQVDSRYIVRGLGLGIVLSFVFWYTMTAVYYLIYRPGPDDASATARTLLLPRWALAIGGPGQKPRLGDALERAELPVRLDWIARALPVQGYRWTIPILDDRGNPLLDENGQPKMKAEQLYEGHFFSLMAAIGFYTLYWVLYPMTAPVLIEFWPKFAMVLYGLGGAIVFFAVVLAKPHPDYNALPVMPILSKEDPEYKKELAKYEKGVAKAHSSEARRLLIWKVILGVLIFVFAAALPTIYYGSDPERFPVLASLLILVISLSWTFGGFAFLLDRFRVPVLTVFIVLLIGPRVINGPSGQPLTGAREEHYLSYSSYTPDPKKPLPTPGDAMDARLRLAYCNGTPCTELPKDVQPTLIVVTSTGGGIHAAAWTTAILGELEKQFNSKFHDNVLLLSTVSGGSVGLYDYLRELDPETNADPRTNVHTPDWDRMTKVARCSSLEAAGWGLIYYDIPKSVLPALPALIAPSDGARDLEDSPLGKDRTWSLRKAMARNLNDPFCTAWAYTAPNGKPVQPNDPQVHEADVSAEQAAAPDNGEKLTLAQLRVLDPVNHYPAFTMNTTTVEGGNRFLLANYYIQRNNQTDPLVSNPARSFLDLYKGVAYNGGVVDLPLATAAQMSATFPYVSSAATLQPAPPENGAHFVDGGYYDNDGTVSAIEFLRYAIDESCLLHPEAKLDKSSRCYDAKAKTPGKTPSKECKTAQPVLRILLVEIRNSSDDPGNAPLVANDSQGKPWNAVGQIDAPLKAFYSAGHGSITARNRNALGLLEGDYDGQLVLEHFVIDDQATALANPPCVPVHSPASDPLNWYLTPCQQIEVDISAHNLAHTDQYQAVKACFDNANDTKSCPKANEEESLR